MTSDLVSKRLFIGGLASNVSDDEILEKFSRFGKISDLSVKHRKDDAGIVQKSFAHLNIEGDEEKIKKCFLAYNNSKWKGSELSLQFAKNSFLDKLVKERQEEKELSEQIVEPPPEHVWEAPKFELKGHPVPGTPVPAKSKSEWIVGKYGRILPVLKLKKSSVYKTVKHDPSKLCHTAKVFKEPAIDVPGNIHCDSLTWEINIPDSEITKKMKGQFPPSKVQKRKAQTPVVIKEASQNKKPRWNDSSVFNETILSGAILKKAEELEIVPIHNVPKCATSENKSNMFDSDIDSEGENVYEDSKIVSQSTKDNKQSKSVQKKVANDRIINSTFKEDSSQKDQIQTRLSNLAQNIHASNNESVVVKAVPSKEVPSQNAKCHPWLMTTDHNTIGRNKLTKKKRKKKALGIDSDTDEECSVPKFSGLSMLSLSQQKDDEVSQINSHKSSDLSNSTTKKTLSVSLNSKQLKSTKPQQNVSVEEDSDSESSNSDNNLDCKNKKGNKSKNDCERSVSASPKKVDSKPAFSSDKSASSLNSSEPEQESDSESSTGTDEIILKHKSKTSTAEAKISTSIPDKTPKSKPTSTDHRLLQSGVAAAAPEVSAINNLHQAPKHESSDDSSDSDLDSNDFKLVAKKLAQKAFEKSSKGQKVKDSQRKALASASNVESPAKKQRLSKEDGSLKQNNSLETSLNESASKNKKLTGNEKRLQALKEKMKLKQQQSQIMQGAFTNIDTKESSKRTVFSSDDDEEEEEDVTEVIEVEDKKEKSKTKSKDTKQLFDSDSESSEDDAEMFESRPHLEGKKGEKLMKLQQRFKDSRFKLDAKFAESGSEGETSESDHEEDKNEEKDKNEDEEDLAAERDSNLKVLEKVVGKATLDQFSQKIKRNTKQMIDMNTVRFDPTKLAAPSNLKVKPEKLSKSKKGPLSADVNSSNPQGQVENGKKQTLPHSELLEKAGEATVLDTDKEKASNEDTSASKVTVSSSLVDLFKKKDEGEDSDGESGGFSLLNQFDKSDQDKSNNNKTKGNSTTNENKKVPLSALFKTGVTSSNKITKPAVKKPQAHVSEESSDDSDDEKEEESIVKKKDVESDDSDEEESDESEDNDSSDDEKNKTNTLSKSKVLDLLQEESDHSETEDQPEAEEQEMEGVDDTGDELTNTDRPDVRYTKEKWLERWTEMRPVIVKIYKRKHKDAVKNKRNQSEMKRRKEFSKNTKRFAWFKRKN